MAHISSVLVFLLSLSDAEAASATPPFMDDFDDVSVLVNYMRTSPQSIKAPLPKHSDGDDCGRADIIIADVQAELDALAAKRHETNLAYADKLVKMDRALSDVEALHRSGTGEDGELLGRLALLRLDAQIVGLEARIMELENNGGSLALTALKDTVERLQSLRADFVAAK